jgi:hypothetical protein
MPKKPHFSTVSVKSLLRHRGVCCLAYSEIGALSAIEIKNFKIYCEVCTYMCYPRLGRCTVILMVSPSNHISKSHVDSMVVMTQTPFTLFSVRSIVQMGRAGLLQAATSFTRKLKQFTFLTVINESKKIWN